MHFRADRVASLYLVKPLLHSAAQTNCVPILMYHSIAEDDETRVRAYYRTGTSRQIFAMHMSYLHRNEYSTLGLDEIKNQLGRPTNPTRSVVITFDDGYQDFYAHAFPILNQYGFNATVFLPTSFIGQKDSRLQFKNRYCMTWNEVRELHRSGISFGSHTITHPQLHRLRRSDLDQELAGSKLRIEQELGAVVDSFSYPFAFREHDFKFKSELRQSLKAAKYSYGVCTTVGRVDSNADCLFMKRLPANSDDDSGLLEAKLAGAYDWISHPQYWTKVARDWPEIFFKTALRRDKYTGASLRS